MLLTTTEFAGPLLTEALLTFDPIPTRLRGEGQEDRPVKLLAFLYDSYLLRRSLKRSSTTSLVWSVGKFRDWKLTRKVQPGEPEPPRTEPTFDDLREETLSRFIRDLEEQKHAPRYIKQIRGNLIAIWNDAAEEYPEQVKAPVTKRIRAVKVPQRTPEAWTFEQVGQLLKVAEQKRGVFRPSGIPKGAYWRAWILIAWDTGIRPSDVQLVRFDQIHNGSLALTQAKTGRVHWAKLSPLTLSAIEAIQEPAREVIVPWMNAQQAFHKAFATIVKRAGLKGTPKKIRKSAASEVERQQPGAAQQFLGHNTPGLAYKNYVDPRIANPDRPAPRSFGGPDDQAAEGA